MKVCVRVRGVDESGCEFATLRSCAGILASDTAEMGSKTSANSLTAGELRVGGDDVRSH